MAIYPNGIAAFTTKRNLLDDVMAVDVNGLQDEIISLEQTIGLTPAKNTNLPGNRTRDYGSVKARLQEMQAGTDIYYASVTRDTQWCSDWTHTTVQMYRDDDPYGMSDGVGLRIPQSGWWSVHLQGSWDDNYRGFRWMEMQVNGQSYVKDVRPSTQTNSVFGLTLGWQGYLAAGQQIRMDVKQTTGQTIAIRGTYLTAHWVRNVVHS